MWAFYRRFQVVFLGTINMVVDCNMILVAVDVYILGADVHSGAAYADFFVVILWKPYHLIDESRRIQF